MWSDFSQIYFHDEGYADNARILIYINIRI